MTFAEHLDPKAVLMQPSAADKWELLRRMVQAMADCGCFPPERKEEAFKAVEARERSMSTGMELGIAVPHAALDGLEHLAAGLAILPQGIDFGTLDGQPSHVVVLLLVPRKEKLIHIRTLAEVARRLSDAVFRKEILEAPDPETVVRLWGHPA